MTGQEHHAAQGVIYLDNGATSFPKPRQVVEAVNRWLTQVGGSPGRSGHRLSTESARIVFEAREAMAGLIGAPSSRQIVFTKNATEALNIAIQGVLTDGDHVVTTSMEHNSVMRPLRHLAAQGRIELTVVQGDGRGLAKAEDVIAAFGGKTRLAAVTHASNVSGTIMAVAELGRACREKGVLLLVDGAQTVGALPIDVVRDGIDLLAFTGHKSLFGPTGTGGLYLREGVEVRPLMRGGTGSDSEFEEQPDFLPDRLESGTLNAVGIAGLKAGIDFIAATGVERVREEEMGLVSRLLEGLHTVPGLTVFGPAEARERCPIVSFNIAGLAPSEVGYVLDEGFGIMCRVGLHCSPSAHRTLGTFPGGSVRFSPGYFNTAEDMEYAVSAVRAIASRKVRP